MTLPAGLDRGGGCESEEKNSGRKRRKKGQSLILHFSLMMNGRNNGKKIMAVRIVQHAFEIIHLVTEQNPIQVLGRFPFMMLPTYIANPVLPSCCLLSPINHHSIYAFCLPGIIFTYICLILIARSAHSRRHREHRTKGRFHPNRFAGYCPSSSCRCFSSQAGQPGCVFVDYWCEFGDFMGELR